MVPYEFKTPPYAHQLEALRLSADREAFALLMEMGTGKTKVIIDNAAHLYERGKVDALVVVANSGSYRNWTTRELDAHLPDRIKHFRLTWKSGGRTKKFGRALDFLLNFKGLVVFAMNYDAVRTRSGEATLRRILEGRTCLFVLDESTMIKTPTSKRTKKLAGFGRGRGLAALAPYRRILTGLPIPEGPFDFYTQFKFLDPSIIDIPTFRAFKARYGIWVTKFNSHTGHEYPELVNYRNLDDLTARVARHSFAISKEECLDLPAKVYEVRRHDLSTEQRRLYDQLRDELVIELNSDTRLTATNVLARLGKLQQICSGHLLDEDGLSHRLGDEQPRLKLLKEIVEELPCYDKVIVWCRFTYEINQICETFKEDAVRFDGAVSGTDREEAINAFQSNDGPRLFVGQVQVGAHGLTLTAASNVIYYSNSFSLELRLQSEDRAHRIGQRKSVTYFDLVANDTVDELIAKTLRDKRDLAQELMSDVKNADRLLGVRT